MQFSSDPRSSFWWLMVSPAENMARLTLLLLDNKLWSDDISRVTSGMIAMQIRGNWGTTVANAWGTLATEKFAAAYESQPVTGETIAKLNAAKQVLDWAKHPDGGKLDLQWPPAQSDLHLEQSGTGNPWAIIQANAAVPITQPISSGYTITKTFAPVDASHTGGWRQGDLVRVHLKIDAQSDMTWVVVNDPIPAGASHLGGGLRRDSQIAVSGEQQSDAFLMGSSRRPHRGVQQRPLLARFRRAARSTPIAPTTATFRRAASRSSTPSASIRPVSFRCRRRESRRSISLKCSARFPTLASMWRNEDSSNAPHHGSRSHRHRRDMAPRRGSHRPTLPEFSEVRARWNPSDAQLLDRNGEPIHEIRIDRHGRRLAWTPLEDISPAVPEAVIASEDHRFLTHHGVDFIAIARGAGEKRLRKTSARREHDHDAVGGDARP